MRFSTLNTGLQLTSIEWWSELTCGLSASVGQSIAKRMKEESLTPQRFTEKYLSDLDQISYNRLAATRCKLEKLFYEDEKEFEAAWLAAFDMELNREALRKEAAKRVKRGLDLPTVEELAREVMEYDRFMCQAIGEYCKTQGWDNLPDEFYDDSAFTQQAKARYILQFDADVIALQEVAPELYEILRVGISDEFAISDEGCQSVLIWRKEMFPGMRRVMHENINDQTIYYQSGNIVIMCIHMTSATPEMSAISYATHAAEARAVMSRLCEQELQVIVAGDCNHHFTCDGFVCLTDPICTDRKKRTYMQRALHKAEVLVSAIKDCILVPEGTEVIESCTMLADGTRVGGDNGYPMIPDTKRHPFDHYVVQAIIKM